MPVAIKSRFTLSSNVSMIKCLTGTDAEVLEFVVPSKSKITKKPLRQLEFPKHAIIGGVIRGTSSFIANGDTQIQDHDHVVVFALPAAFHKLDKFFN